MNCIWKEQLKGSISVNDAFRRNVNEERAYGLSDVFTK
jgi:hypothetical protein